jgi:DNA-binding Lrp family transcriptional regulator
MVLGCRSFCHVKGGSSNWPFPTFLRGNNLGEHKAKKIDQEELLDKLFNHVPRKEIANELGISMPTLSNRIAKLQERQGLLLQYRSLQSLQLTELQARILESITPDKIEEAPLRDLVLCYKILKEKELVTEGKPSEIKGLVSYLVHLEKEQLACEEPVPVSSYNDFEITDNDLPRL